MVLQLGTRLRSPTYVILWINSAAIHNPSTNNLSAKIIEKRFVIGEARHLGIGKTDSL